MADIHFSLSLSIHSKLYLDQCFSILALKTHCPAGFSVSLLQQSLLEIGQQVAGEKTQTRNHPSVYLDTVFIRSTYVGEAVNVERQPFRHCEHLYGEPAFLRQTVNRQPVERVVDRTAVDGRTEQTLV